MKDPNFRAPVGAKNVTAALKCLRALDIEVVARRTGGKNGMLIRLFTATGDVLVRRIASSTSRGAVSIGVNVWYVSGVRRPAR